MQIHGVPCAVSALEEEDRIREIQFTSEHRPNILGNIYVGQVQRVIPNIHSAFIMIQNGLTCYYSLKEESTAIYAQPYRHSKIAPGDQILVQVSKEAMKGKVPSVTTRLLKKDNRKRAGAERGCKFCTGSLF